MTWLRKGKTDPKSPGHFAGRTRAESAGGLTEADPEPPGQSQFLGLERVEDGPALVAALDAMASEELKQRAEARPWSREAEACRELLWHRNNEGELGLDLRVPHVPQPVLLEFLAQTPSGAHADAFRTLVSSRHREALNHDTDVAGVPLALADQELLLATVKANPGSQAADLARDEASRRSRLARERGLDCRIEASLCARDLLIEEFGRTMHTDGRRSVAEAELEERARQRAASAIDLAASGDAPSERRSPASRGWPWS